MDGRLLFALAFEVAGDIYSSKFPGYKEAVLRADGLILVISEYNHGYPGMLKNALDTLFNEKELGHRDENWAAWYAGYIVDRLRGKELV